MATTVSTTCSSARVRRDGFAVVDWQNCGVSNGLYDVAYFFAGSVPTEIRRAVERDALEEYHDIVCSLGARDFTFEHCWRLYRETLLACLVLPVVATAGLEEVPGTAVAPPGDDRPAYGGRCTGSGRRRVPAPSAAPPESGRAPARALPGRLPGLSGALLAARRWSSFFHAANRRRAVYHRLDDAPRGRHDHDRLRRVHVPVPGGLPDALLHFAAP